MSGFERLSKKEVEYNLTRTISIPFNFLFLPNVVIENILDYLNIFTLKKLRVVSKATKNLVEQSRYLKKFVMNISSPEIHQELFQFSSPVKWNNFRIMYSCLYDDQEKLHSELKLFIFHNFMNKYGPSITRLDVHIELDYTECCIILNGISSKIQTLVFNNLNFSSSNNYDISKIWIKNLLNLEILKFYKFTISNIKHTHSFFYNIFTNCPNLKYLKIPHVYIKNYENDNLPLILANAEFLHTFIINPLYKFFNENSLIQRNLIIDLAESKNFDSTVEHTLQNTQLFYEFVLICSKIGVKLINFPCNRLPNYGESYLNTEAKQMYDDVVTSVNAINTDLTNYYIPSECEMNVELDYCGSNHNLFELIGSIHSIKISFHFLSHSYFDTVVIPAIRNIMFKVRPTVEILHCESSNMPFKFVPKIIPDNFPNLKQLVCTLKFENNDFYTNLFLGLPQLEFLKLNWCKNLTDDGIIGRNMNNPAILHLKKLTHLEMGDARITDYSFIHAIRHMGLKTFIFEYFGDKVYSKKLHCAVTFHSGISSLRKGKFANTIEHLQIIIPDDCNESDILKFGNRFKNIRNVHCFIH